MIKVTGTEVPNWENLEQRRSDFLKGLIPEGINEFGALKNRYL